MITATIVVFLAIFGGMAILGLMIWLISRRNRGNSSSNNFVGGASQTNYQNRGSIHDDSDDLDVAAPIYSESETPASEQTASDSPTSSETYESASTQSDYSPPADYSYSDSSSSSSYDSGGSSDSGSSSSSSD